MKDPPYTSLLWEIKSAVYKQYCLRVLQVITHQRPTQRVLHMTWLMLSRLHFPQLHNKNINLFPIAFLPLSLPLPLPLSLSPSLPPSTLSLSPSHFLSLLLTSPLSPSLSPPLPPSSSLPHPLTSQSLPHPPSPSLSPPSLPPPPSLSPPSLILPPPLTSLSPIP